MAAAAAAQDQKRVKVAPKLQAVHNIEAWYEENKALFSPPVCNKLMFKEQLNIMFVGGPNTRTDFHLDLGSEFFFQMKGNMRLPTIQKGQRKVVEISEGHVFLLPSRIPHSPQRPEAGSFGLVIERSRAADEKDGLRWYTDFESPDKVLWERYFHCGDLGRDLVPVVKDFKASPEAASLVPGDNVVADADRPWHQDTDTTVPDPFPFADFVAAHKAELDAGAALPLFSEDHPDNEFSVLVCGGGGNHDGAVRWKHDTWLYQHTGTAKVAVDGEVTELAEGCCAVVPADTWYSVERAAGSVGLVVMQDPLGNKGDGAKRPVVEAKA
mmetsp:Transcript_3074/g.7328  ORF Transcript_3074/g.7328 Transcript_3074/m.7328 type:complete len:325 (+) Transcript_3074:40-1014(+)